MDYEAILGSIAVALNVGAFWPYITDTLRGKTKPHMYSWFIWSLITGIVFIGQLSEHAGPGAWATGVTTVINLIILALSIKRGTSNITRGDKICLASAIAAFAIWYVSDSLLFSILLVTIIDLIAFIPTIRKSLKLPHEETFITYPISVLRCVFGLLAITNYTIVTTAYPIAMLAIYLLMTIILLPKQHFYKKWQKVFGRLNRNTQTKVDSEL